MKTTRVLVLAAVAAATLVAVGAQPALAIQGGGEPSAAGDGLSYVGRLTAVRQIDSTSEVGERCGAALIAPRWAVTAKHCLNYDGRSRQGDFAPSDVTITFGSRRADGVGGHTATVAEILRGGPDIALLRLTEDVPVAPVALADQAPPQSAPVVALGWGRGTGAAPLKAADMRVDRPASTPSWFDPASILVTVPDSRAAHPGAAYHGDSGGPLVVPTQSGGYALAGIARSSIGARGGDVANAWVRTDGDSSTHAWIVEHAGGTPAQRGVGGAHELS